MGDALSTACKGQPSDYSAILAVSGKHYAMTSWEYLSLLPKDLTATTPQDFYYAICISRNRRSYDMCKYFDNHPITELRTVVGFIVPIQISWSIEIRESRTGEVINSTEISGSKPTCPSEASFSTRRETKYITGTEPSPSDVFDWIRKALEKQDMEKGK
jgi:hypothetical protein